MRIHKFETTEAFIAIDLEGAEASSGLGRALRERSLSSTSGKSPKTFP